MVGGSLDGARIAVVAPSDEAEDDRSGMQAWLLESTPRNMGGTSIGVLFAMLALQILPLLTPDYAPLLRDFVPVAPINYSDLVLVVHPAVAANSLSTSAFFATFPWTATAFPPFLVISSTTLSASDFDDA